MDEQRFDALARAVSTGTSRRRVLGVLAGSLGAMLGGDLVTRAQGNSKNAKACQKGGWQTQARSETPTVPFASESECASYGAQGGTLVALVVNPCAGQDDGTPCSAGVCCGKQCQDAECCPENNAGCTGGQTCDQGSCCTPKICVQGTDCGTFSSCGDEVDCGSCPSDQCLTCATNTCVLTCGANQGCDGGACACTSGFTGCQTPDGLTCSAGPCCRDRYERCCDSGVLSVNLDCCANGMRDVIGSCCDSGLFDPHGHCCRSGIFVDDQCCDSGILKDDGQCCESGILDNSGRCCCDFSVPGEDVCETGVC